MSLRYLELLPENSRPQIYKGIETIVSRYGNESGTSIMVPPRFGKSDIIRGGALELGALGATTSIVLVPWIELADQIKEKSKIEAMYRRFNIPQATQFLCHRCIKMPSSGWWHPYNGSYNLISLTIGLANANTAQFFDGLEELRDTLGKPVPVFIDECHLVKKNQPWANLAEKAQDIGCYIVPLTGTPVPGMPEFEQLTSDWRDVTFKLHRRKVVQGNIEYVEATYEGQKRDVDKIVGDVHVDWKTAWAEGALAKVSVVWIDTDVIDSDTGDSLGKLSELNKDQLRGRLKQIVESPDMIQKTASAAVDRCLTRKERPQGLIVTAFDYSDSERNSHAKAFKKALRSALGNSGCDPDQFRIEIATGTNDEGFPNEQAIRLIKDFIAGKIDFLIVKMMGLVGLDVPRCKVLGFASPMSQGPLVAQALSRVLTIWILDSGAADLILPNHVLMRETFDRMIRDQGGACETNVVQTNEEPAAPPDQRNNSCFAQDSIISGYSDQYGNIYDGDSELLLRIIKIKYNIGNLTDPELLENYQRGAFGISETDRQQYQAQQKKEHAWGFKDLDEDLDDVRGKFGDKARKIVNRHVDYRSNPDLWRQSIRELQTTAKEICGVKLTVEVNEIDDAEKLRELIAKLDQAEKRYFG